MNDSKDEGDRDRKSRSRRKNEGEDEFTMFLKMLEKSEARIDRTNVMISRLVDACKSVENAYTSHVGSLQSSRDTSQKNNAKLISLLDRITKSIDREKDELQRQNALLEKDKNALRSQLHSATEKYWKLQEDYRRLAESLTGSRNTYTIGCNNGGSANSNFNH